MLSEIIRNVRNVAHGGVGGSGAELQAVRSGSIRDSDIGIILWHNILAAVWLWVRLSLQRNEYQDYFLGVKAESA